jgi:hypothetical protein
MTCLFNARAYRDGSAAAPRRPDTAYWVLGCRGLVREHLVPRVQGAGLPRRGPTRVQGVPTAIAPLKDISNLQSMFFLVPCGPWGGSGGGSGGGPCPVPRQPIWDPIGGCVACMTPNKPWSHCRPRSRCSTTPLPALSHHGRRTLRFPSLSDSITALSFKSFKSLVSLHCSLSGRANNCSAAVWS